MKMQKFMVVAMALFGVSMAVFAEETLLNKVQTMAPSATAFLDAKNLNTWKRTSFNSNNLQVKNGVILVNSEKVGPLIHHEFMETPSQMIEINFNIKPLEVATNKSAFQCAVFFDSPKNNEKSNLYGYRIGKGKIRFLDESPKDFDYNENDSVNVKILINTVTGVSEVYINDETTPIIKHAPLMIKKTAAKISMGDGTAGVVGKCELITAEVKEY